MRLATWAAWLETLQRINDLPASVLDKTIFYVTQPSHVVKPACVPNGEAVSCGQQVTSCK